MTFWKARAPAKENIRLFEAAKTWRRCLLSLVDGRPVGSRQKNLTELLNTFLGVKRRHRFARLVRRFAERCRRHDVLGARSVQTKLDKAFEAAQDDPKTFTGRIALRLFPEIFAWRSSGSSDGT